MSWISDHSTPVGTSQDNLATTVHKEIDEAKITISMSTFCKEIDKAKNNTESMSSARIYRVPKELRELNGSDYTPRLVSIGPLHSKDEHLNAHMQEIKLSYLESLLYETSKGNQKEKEKDAEEKLTKCWNEMAGSKDKAQKYYAEQVELDEKMLVTDGCFILEVLRRAYEPEETPGSSSQVTEEDEKKLDAISPGIVDPIFDIPLTYEAVLNDLLLLENQLPLFVLEKLFECTFGCKSKSKLRDYVLRVFSGRLTIGDASTNSNATNWCGRLGDCVLSLGEGNNNNDPTPPKKVDCPPPDHILHLLYNHYLGDPPQSQDQGKKRRPRKEFKDMLSASDLAYKGVKFERCKNLSEVDFKTLGPCRGASFWIPTLYVGDCTVPILRNLIALEQCCPEFRLPYFTSYAYLMDRLVNTEKDIEELGGGGLISHSLGNSKEASRFFNSLCKGVTLCPDLYVPICKEAVKYSGRSWYRVIPATTTHLKCKFRASPWTSVAFFIAFVSFGISSTNFIRSFLG